jgi:TRAP-type C4-dicarboxylate transport system permease small subunit
MSGKRNKANRVADYYIKVLRGLTLGSGIAILVMMLYVTGDVTGRYLFSNPLPASFEISEMIMIFVVFWALAYVQARDEHLKLGFFIQLFPPRGKAILKILAFLIGILIFAIITWQAADWGVKALLTNEYTQGYWRIPYGPPRLMLALGAFITTVQFVVDLIKQIHLLFTESRK